MLKDIDSGADIESSKVLRRLSLPPDTAKTIPSTRHGRALVADDDLTGRLMLRSLLSRQGFEVVLAEDGAQAVERFGQGGFDLVFLDLNMPVMDGREACRRIKALAGEDFVPVVFVTGTTDEMELVRCLAAGGDDFVVKPFSPSLLAAKTQALERIRALQRRVHSLYARVQADQVLAERVFSGVVLGNNVESSALKTKLVTAETFGGDLVLAAYRPSGDLHLLLGDFTGHGLASALGAMPTAEAFRTMTAKGFALPAILAEINRKLRAVLPVGMFLAAHLVSVSRQLDNLSIANCGMPAALLIDTEGRLRRLPAGVPPIGVGEAALYEDAFLDLPILAGESMLLASDGVFEAQSPSGEHFGAERLERCAAAQPGAAFDAVLAAIDGFRDGAPAGDDISLVELRLLPELFAPMVTEPAPMPPEPEVAQDCGSLRLGLQLKGKALGQFDPVPLLLSQLGEFVDLQEHRGVLFTILAELYANALDHGVLGLDSRLKSGADGFKRYLEARQSRLDALASGWVRILIECSESCSQPRLRIEVEDSGAGFDWAAVLEKAEAERHGRGLALVTELCESLQFTGPGNRAEAVYRCAASPSKA